MQKSEVIRLFMLIAESYPTFDSSDENLERHVKYLRDFSLDAAIQNVEQHILTNKFPPTIAEIRGSLGDQEAWQREIAETRTYLRKRELHRQQATLPPPGWKEDTLARLRV